MITKLKSIAVGFSLLYSITVAVSFVTAAKGDSSVGTLEEVVITARRVEENLQNTPVSVTAFTSEALEKRQIYTTEMLDQVTPNLQFTNNTALAGNNNSSTIFIRGVGQTDPTSSVDPGVGLYIDDVYVGQSIGGTFEFRDIASVQVLRGPQGTLFGKNTIGGAVLLNTVAPGDAFATSFRVGVGSDALRDALIAVDIPLSANVKSRFTLGIKQQDGYVQRVQTGEDLGDTDSITATGKVVWDLGDNFTARVQFDYTRADENGVPFVFAASTETATFQRVASADAGCPGFNGSFKTLPAVPPIDDDRCANDFQNKGEYKNNGTYPIESKTKNLGASLHLNYALSENVTLKSITAYRSLEWEGIRDADNTPLTILHTDYDSDGDQFSQEFQYLYQKDKLSGVIGLFYFQEEIDDILYVQLNIPPPGIEEDSDNNLAENHNWALFSQWTYDVNEKLSLTLGGRYTEDTKGSTPDQFNYANPMVKYLPVVLYEETFTDFSASASASYRFNHDVMGYLSYSEAFKGGGWNSHFNSPQSQANIDQFHAFDPEEVQTFELGVKMDLLNDTLRVNGSIFSTDYEDLQFTYRVGIAPYLANAGKASIDGWELETTWVPSDSLTIEAGIGYLDSSVDTLASIAGTAIGVAVGNTLPFSPELQTNLGVAYTFSLDSGWTLTPRFDWFYQNKTYFDANNTVEIAQIDSLSVINLGLTLKQEAGPWLIRFGINNANDERYATGGNSSLTTGSGYAEIAYARPREYFASLSYGF